MNYDILMLGHISQDVLIDHQNVRQDIVGGAVVYSSFAAGSAGKRVKVITKLAAKDLNILKDLEHPLVDWDVLPSRESTSIKNTYFTADKERREVILLSRLILSPSRKYRQRPPSTTLPACSAVKFRLLGPALSKGAKSPSTPKGCFGVWMNRKILFSGTGGASRSCFPILPTSRPMPPRQRYSPAWMTDRRPPVSYTPGGPRR
jgi:hypothetical protein